MNSINKNIIKDSHNGKFSHLLETPFGDNIITFETGKVAKQSSASILVGWGKSIVLVTVCYNQKNNSRMGFFPLTCEYIEKSYAAGKIPGGFFKRETRPKESDIIKARMIDRSIRPLFPKKFNYEVQIIATVLSHDNKHETDAMTICGTSMALTISELPFALKEGAIASTRVIKKLGVLIANPIMQECKETELNIIVTSSKASVLMIEGQANEISEEELLDALIFAQEKNKKIILCCNQMQKILGKEKIKFQLNDNYVLPIEVKEQVVKDIDYALKICKKDERNKKINQIYENMIESSKIYLKGEFEDKVTSITKEFINIKNHLIRNYIISNDIRIDQRKPAEIRSICSETSVLPMAHGSSVFTRGETQALVSVTLGINEDQQRIDNIHGEKKSNFLLHYNFPPYSVGETRFLKTVSRREIGHGTLAKRAFQSLLPKENIFPYTIRIVSEILESNGSSSMATVCGATLSLFDAGVKLKKTIAGIAMGMINEGNKIMILSDISGEEDSCGDMDLKICGTKDGITAIQMDVKINKISKSILNKVLIQAKKGKELIINKMEKTIKRARKDLSNNAPRIISFKINPDRIRDIIGPGGKIIRDISLRTGTKIEITDDGIIQISAIGKEKTNKAKQIIKELTKTAEINTIYKGIVKRIADYGIFVELFPGTEGLCHISEISNNKQLKIRDMISMRSYSGYRYQHR